MDFKNFSLKMFLSLPDLFVDFAAGYSLLVWWEVCPQKNTSGESAGESAIRALVKALFEALKCL